LPCGFLSKVDESIRFFFVNEALAQQIARNWLEAWNRHDLEAILEHYSEGIEFTSPFVARLGAESSGMLRGKVNLRRYFAKALAAYPDLSFTLLQMLNGVDSLTLLYQSVNQLLAAEIMTLDPANQIVRVQAHYTDCSGATSIPNAPEPREWMRGEYLLTDNSARLDLDAVCALLQSTYWASDRSREVIEKSLRHSTSLHLIHGGKQVGLIRGVTDHVTFTWLCDVVVDTEHRSKGLGKWMVKCFLEHPGLQTISHHLCTKDAHSLYEGFGFKRIEAMRRSDRPMPFLLA